MIVLSTWCAQSQSALIKVVIKGSQLQDSYQTFSADLDYINRPYLFQGDEFTLKKVSSPVLDSPVRLLYVVCRCSFLQAQHFVQTVSCCGHLALRLVRVLHGSGFNGCDINTNINIKYIKFIKSVPVFLTVRLR